MLNRPRYFCFAHCLLHCLLLVLLNGLTLLHAHSNTYIFALVDVNADGEVRLELTMDIGENALVADAAEARTVLAQAVSILINERIMPLSELGTFRYEERQQHDADAPGIGTENETHPLLTAIWSGQVPTRQFKLRTPKRTPFDIVLWTRDPSLIADTPKSTLLILNELSPLITLPAKTPFPWAIVCMIFGALVGVLIGKMCYSRQSIAQPAG